MFVGLLAASIAENLVSGDLIWTVFLAAALVVLVLPAVAARDSAAMLPPEVTALAVLPAVTRALGPAWATEYATYLSVAALALAVVAELSLFTSVEMAPWLANAMVVLTTMAAIGVWAVLQFYSDAFLGTHLVGSADDVNVAFVRATVAGLAAAVVFERYFADHADAESASDLPEGETG
ncbi:hypothetical protein [Halorussus caseinilyticus]|uniref:Uncharacterized protein n=1 Tax=Halorussus caseinilyticus TaxID=3034025 RepID=A0ABD5WLH6_9EURY